MDDAEVIAKNCRVGLEFDGAERFRHRFFRPALVEERTGESRSHLSIIRCERHGAAQAVLGTDDVAHVQQGRPRG